MTPELESCLNYCDGEHGETPFLPTLHGLIVNAVSAETSALRAEIEQYKGAAEDDLVMRGDLRRQLYEATVQLYDLRNKNKELGEEGQ